MGPPCSIRIARVPTYSSLPNSNIFRLQGYHLVSQQFPMLSAKLLKLLCNWATPRSLAATDGISVDFFSSCYLDVSVRKVCLLIFR